MMDPVEECFGHLPAIERAAMKRRRAKAIAAVSTLLALLIVGGMLAAALGWPLPS